MVYFYYILRVSDQNGVSPLPIMLEIHHSSSGTLNLFYCFLRRLSLSFLHFPALSLVSNDYCSLYHFQSFPISLYVTGPCVPCKCCETCRPGLWLPVHLFHCFLHLPSPSFVSTTTLLAEWLRCLPREQKTRGSNPACDRIFLGPVVPVT